MSILASDTFTRADNADLGTDWTVLPSDFTFNVVSNAAGFNPPNSGFDCGEYWSTGSAPPDDQYATATLKATHADGVGIGFGVCVRASTSVKTRYRLVGNASGYEFGKAITGTFTSLASGSGTTFAAADMITLEMSGTTPTLKKNGSSFGTPPSDSAIASGRFAVFYSSPAPVNDAIDTWEGGDLAAPNPIPTYFPDVTGTATTDGSTASATPSVNLPSGIKSGDLLLVLFRCADGTTGVGWPAGWNELFDSTADGSNDATALAYRWAEGNEAATIALSCTSSKFAALSWRINGAENPSRQVPEYATLVTGASATPDPGSLSPTGGSKKYLWMWMGGWEGEQDSPPASNPTDYADDKIGASSATAGVVATNCRVASATRSFETATQDPGSWTISASDDWTATVVAIHPAKVAVQPEITHAAPRRRRSAASRRM